MAFIFKQASCVVVGTFNIYIIQPAWLKQVGLLPEGIKGVGLEADLTEPGFRMRLPKITWRVAPTRISLETDSWDVDCGETMATICDKLPWTPLKAVGINTRHEAPITEMEDFAERFAHPATDADCLDDCKLEQTTWHACFRKEDQQYNLQLTLEAGTAVLTTNVHTDLRRTSVQVAKPFVANFRSIRDEAVRLAATVFQVTIA